MNVEAFRVRSKSANLEEAGKVALPLLARAMREGHHLPDYIVAGTKDRLTPHTQAENSPPRSSGPCVLSVIEGGNHVVNNLWLPLRDQTADWMAQQTPCGEALRPDHPARFAGTPPQDEEGRTE